MDVGVSGGNNGSFVGAVKNTLSKFGTVDGRASRSEFWYFMLFTAVGAALAGFVDAALGTEWVMLADGQQVAYFGHVQFAWFLATIVPTVTVTARRLHDTGKSGWLQLLLLVPFLGWALLLYWFCCAGPKSENGYGQEPLYFA